MLQAIGQCYNAIDTFFSRNKKFQTSLGGNGKRKEQWHDRFLDALRILEWHRYKKEEVVQFQWIMNGHITAIHLITQSIQM